MSCCLAAWCSLFLRLPTSFLPLEDRGMFTTSVQLPSGSTQQQTLKVVEQIEKYYFTHEKRQHHVGVCHRGFWPWG